jgi:DNA invertase Pin-like site-specific DNA recombinase
MARGHHEGREMNTTTNAIGYVRVSTDSQAESGAGLAAQRHAIEAFAKRQGLVITAWHEDAGVSGAAGIESRPGLMAAIAGLGRGDVLLVAKRDRIARDTLTALTIERTVSRRKAAIMSADGIGNGDGAADQFMRSVLDAAAAFERDLIKARTKAALAAKRQAGERTGQIPFGWSLGDDGRLVEVEAEQRVLDNIKACRAAGMSLRQIANVLTEANVPTKAGRGTWSHNTIDSILKRAAALAA